MAGDAIVLEVTSSQINSGVKKANALEGTAAQINVKLDEISELENTFVTGENMYNKDTVTAGYYVNNATGALKASSGYNASDWIMIEPETTYTKRTTSTYAFYNADREYISGGTGSKTITSPANAKFVRISVEDSMLNTNTFVLGSSQSYNRAYYNQFKYQSPYDFLFNDIRGSYQTIHRIEFGTYQGEIDQRKHYRRSDDTLLRTDDIAYTATTITEVRTLASTNTTLTFVKHLDTEVLEIY